MSEGANMSDDEILLIAKKHYALTIQIGQGLNDALKALEGDALGLGE